MKLKKIAVLIIAGHIIFAAAFGALLLMRGKNEKAVMVMGAVLLKNEKEKAAEARDSTDSNKAINERYFRPSNLQAINVGDENEKLLQKLYENKSEEVKLPKELLKNPWETIINYYSILREAANMEKNKRGGCGTVGWEGIPYPIAYNFLSKEYKNRVNYKTYVDSFKGIAHINLVKLKNITDTDGSMKKLKYFIEIETLEPAEDGSTYFAYYYGNVLVTNEDEVFKISDVQLYKEDFLCAAYHGWRYNAESYVDVTYGNWCKLIEKRLPTVQEGYTKNIDIKGTDGKEYRFQFVQLTNGIDIEIGQYLKEKDNTWKAIKIDPEKCLAER
jgi:hypothetical protein